MDFKNTTLTQYEGLAMRSIKPHTSKELAIADWGLGLGGELSEVVDLIYESKNSHTRIDKMEFTKEVGDILWYVVALAKEIGAVLPEDIFACDIEHFTIERITIVIGQIQEGVKHGIMHKEGINSLVIVNKLCEVIVLLKSALNSLDISIGQCAALNAGKLAHRYNLKNGGAYSNAASADRHEAELKFEDTATYKRLYNEIVDFVYEITPDDVEVL